MMHTLVFTILTDCPDLIASEIGTVLTDSYSGDIFQEGATSFTVALPAINTDPADDVPDAPVEASTPESPILSAEILEVGTGLELPVIRTFDKLDSHLVVDDLVIGDAHVEFTVGGISVRIPKNTDAGDAANFPSNTALGASDIRVTLRFAGIDMIFPCVLSAEESGGSESRILIGEDLSALFDTIATEKGSDNENEIPPE